MLCELVLGPRALLCGGLQHAGDQPCLRLPPLTCRLAYMGNGKLACSEQQLADLQLLLEEHPFGRADSLVSSLGAMIICRACQAIKGC